MRRAYTLLASVVLLWLAQLSIAVAAEQGLLWHISGKGAEGYLLGTMHSDDPRVIRLQQAVQRYLDAADTLMLEVALDAQTQMAVAQEMMLPVSSSLSAVVGEELGRQAQQAMLGLGVPPEVTERMQPWATVVTLSMPKMESGLVLDAQLYQQGIAAGKKFVPLESPEEQLSVFTGLSNDEQKALLRHVLSEYQSYPAMFEQLTEAYLRGDLEAIVRMSKANPMSSDPALQQKMMTSLLEERNQRMVARLVPELGKGKVFVAVGALHLPEEQGLLALLRQRGFQVRAVD